MTTSKNQDECFCFWQLAALSGCLFLKTTMIFLGLPSQCLCVWSREGLCVTPGVKVTEGLWRLNCHLIQFIIKLTMRVVTQKSNKNIYICTLLWIDLLLTVKLTFCRRSPAQQTSDSECLYQSEREIKYFCHQKLCQTTTFQTTKTLLAFYYFKTLKQQLLRI